MAIFKNLKKWQNYAHYILLAVGVFLWHAIPYNEIVEQFFINNTNILGYLAIILWWTIGLFVIDTIVHTLFYILPKPLQWRD